MGEVFVHFAPTTKRGRKNKRKTQQKVEQRTNTHKTYKHTLLKATNTRQTKQSLNGIKKRGKTQRLDAELKR